MELYTFVSLCIGVFGATYAALNAVRTHMEYGIKHHYDQSTEKYEGYKSIKGEAHESTKIVAKHHGRVKFWRNIWNYAHIIPALACFLVMFAIAIWVLFDWERVTNFNGNPTSLANIRSEVPWCYFSKTFAGLLIIDGLAITCAFTAYGFCRAATGRVAEFNKMLDTPVLKDPGQG